MANSFGQFPEKLKNGLRLELDSTQRHHITLNMTAQLWARYTDLNPGSVVVTQAEPNVTDFSIRRIRFILSGALTDRVNFFVQFGQNNLNYLSARKAGSFFHDITADYAVVPKKLSIGMGLNGWNGPSRFSNIAVSSIMVIDPPAFQEVTSDTYDQFVRRLGVYAKGKLQKLDYRVSVAKPFMLQTAGVISGADPINESSAFSTLPTHLAYQGYFSYQFLESESNFGPATIGSYQGRKKVFNLGGGFYYQKNGTFHYTDIATKDTTRQNIVLLSVDVFYDAPLNEKKGTALSAYASFSHYDYGYNFIKLGSASNPATRTAYQPAPTNPNRYFTQFNYGNAYPYLGTGNIGYVQVGYKLRNHLLNDQGTLQPYANFQYARYDRLANPMYVFNVGVNWLIYGNNSKISLNYQNRPYFVSNAGQAPAESKRLAEWVVQYQVAF
ncbi:MAG: hypothetical protein JST69_09045 [Bacteroidetes bacterium]|nr:hypothetical protein [Bacteroidota bacterium]